MQETDHYENDNGSIILDVSKESSFSLSKSPLEPSKPSDIFKPSVILRRYELIEELERYLYTFDNREDVYAFLLRASNSVMDVLNEAPSHVTPLFGAVPLRLEVIRDPEEDSEILFIEIKTDLPAGRAVDLLDTLDDEWWLEVDTSARKMLAIDV